MGYNVVRPPGGGGGPGPGGGDMTKAVYDQNDDGIVDQANATDLQGVPIDAGVAGAADGDVLTFDSGSGEFVAEPLGNTFQQKATNPGNPNGVVDGRIGDECLDTTTKFNYVKTTPLGTLTGWTLQ